MEENNNTIPSCPFTPCGCVGYGYVPKQSLSCIYDVSSALRQGTVFPELDLTIDEYGSVCKVGDGNE